VRLRWSVFIDNPDNPELISLAGFGIHQVLAPTWWEAREKAAELLMDLYDGEDDVELDAGSRALVVTRSKGLR